PRQDPRDPHGPAPIAAVALPPPSAVLPVVPADPAALPRRLDDLPRHAPAPPVPLVLRSAAPPEPIQKPDGNAAPSAAAPPARKHSSHHHDKPPAETSHAIIAPSAE